MTIKVLVVDDSALIRSLLGEIIKDEPGLSLVGAAPDAYAARDMVNQFAPDVITLDVEMPKVDGLTFLDRLMKARPTPVLMISTLTEQGADVTLQALELGAVDFIPKPKIGIAEGINEYRDCIVEKIRLASGARVGRRLATPLNRPKKVKFSSTEKIIAVGASTGGTEAIKTFLMQLPANCPAVVITQHMPPGFTSKFASRLDNLCSVTVREAQNGERLLPGHAYLAPGDYHLMVQRSGADYIVQLDDGERVSGHKPSVDVMFDSLVHCAAINTVAVLLTGMGKDGARSMKALRDNGAYTLAQDEASSVVYGMPREAAKLGATDAILPLEAIADNVLQRLTSVQASSRV